MLRVYNPGRRAARVGLETEAAVSLLRLDETEERPLELRTLALRAGEIATLRLRPRARSCS